MRAHPVTIALAPADASPRVAQAWALLESLTDPEIPVVTLRELGILRDVREQGEALEVVITPTYSGCPAMGQIEDDVRSTLQAAGLRARVITQLAPAWSTDWISEAGRRKLREYGIAPPQGRTAPTATGELTPAQRVLRFMPRAPEAVPCPRCGSSETSETSHFGSTACKAMYRCLACREPFDYFKPYLDRRPCLP